MSVVGKTAHRGLDSIVIVPAFRFQEPSVNECVNFRYV
jgi:hypothetical protein